MDYIIRCSDGGTEHDMKPTGETLHTWVEPAPGQKPSQAATQQHGLKCARCGLTGWDFEQPSDCIRALVVA